MQDTFVKIEHALYTIKHNSYQQYIYQSINDNKKLIKFEILNKFCRNLVFVNNWAFETFCRYFVLKTNINNFYGNNFFLWADCFSSLHYVGQWLFMWIISIW